MTKRDARSLNPEAQEEIRRLAVKKYKEGIKIIDIAKDIEVHRTTVGGWIKAYKTEGVKAIKSNVRGRKVGSGKKLNMQQEKEIQSLIIDKDPDQLKLDFALWTREAVQLLIKEKTGIEIKIRSVGNYLKDWGFTPQRPAKRAYQRNDAKVKLWMEEEYPNLKERAKKEGGEIHWADEAGIKSHDHRGRGYSPKGQTPIRLHNPAYEKVNMISSITNQGKLRFMCYKDTFTYQTFHKFLKSLIHDSMGKKVFVVVDNLRVHHSKVIKRWLKWFCSKIEVHYLPSYTPDLNPDEYFNCDKKTELSKRPERRKKGEWENVVNNTLSDLEKQPERIQKYFKSKHIQYAA